MHIRFLHRLVVTSFLGISCATASPGVATITAWNSPAWLQQGDNTTRIGRNSELKIGDTISTGETGRIQMELWEGAILQLNTNSEITIREEKGSGASSSGVQPELYIHRGRACINYIAQIGSDGQFRVNMGSTMFAAIHHLGEICVLRSSYQNYIKLRTGSVQITHSVDPDIIILSEAGSEVHMEDSGSYRILFPGDGLSALEIEQPFVLGKNNEEVPPTVPDETVEKERVEVSETESGSSVNKEGSSYIYTVYLFSTREEEVAQKVNQRFLEAGHDTQVIVSTVSSTIRYRVAATGFESNQSAKEFANSIVGKLGVSDTWIGKNPK